MRAVSTVIVAIVLAIGGAGVHAGAAAPQQAWTIRPSAGPVNGTLDSVSCTAVSCFAVGQQTAGDSTITTLTERPTRTGWEVVPSPSPAGAVESVLSGVSCPSVCFAVGHSIGPGSTDRALIEMWDGATWTIVPSPNKSHWPSRLRSISCTTAIHCFAVGEVAAVLQETLILRWNGVKWFIVPSPSRRPSPNFEIPGVNELQSVSCASAVSCFAVGSDRGSLNDFRETLILRWNGEKWSIVPSPNSSRAKYSNLSSVSCPGGNTCYAVGQTYGNFEPDATMKTFIARWDGKTWTRVVSADRVGSKRSSLLGISCTSATSCTAVGTNSGSAGRNNKTLVKSLSGTTWSIVASPNPPAATYASLNAVDCVGATYCSAVGFFASTSLFEPLVEHS